MVLLYTCSRGVEAPEDSIFTQASRLISIVLMLVLFVLQQVSLHHVQFIKSNMYFDRWNLV